MDIQEKEVLIAEIERFKEEAMKSYVVSCWAESYTNTDPFGYVILENKNNKVWWLKTQAYQLWEMWQAAKAQAVPETQQALNDRLLVKSIREHVESHIAEVSVNDLFDKGWLAAMKCIQNNIDMLEAVEQNQ